jgi:NADH oxidase (H2O2-forming)
MRSNSGLQYPLSENIKNNKKTVDIKGEFKEVFFEGRSSAQGPPKENLNKVVIIGGGACGMATATKIRRLSDFEITVLSSDSHTAYSHCGIPFVLSHEIENFEKLIVKSRDFFKENEINVRLSESVKSIDLNSKLVKTSQGNYTFEKLVIATGSLPFIPRMGHRNILPYGIFTLRSLSDGILFEKALKKAEKICIIGGGTIGIECAVAFVKRGIKTALITRSESLLSKQLDPDIAEIVKLYLENLGIEVISGTEATIPENFWEEKFVHAEGRKLPADLILIASGVRPEISLAMEAGIEIGETGGIVVNELLQVKVGDKFIPYVYAGGECAEVIDFVTGEVKLSQLGTTARHMADVIGNNVVGKNTSFKTITDPWVAVAGGLQFGGVGITMKKAEEHNMKIISGFSRGRTRASYYPGRKDLFIKLLIKDTFLVGAQLAGGEGIKERVDGLSLAIRKRTTIRDLLEMETCYTPPVSMLIDPILPAVKAAARNMLQKN